MRNIFLSLLVLNVGFFGWARWIDRPRDVAVASTSSPSVPSLELTQLPPPPAPTTPPTHCRSIGPFADAAAAAGTADALHSHGLQPRARNVDTLVPDGYWVYVEDLKDAAARRKVITALNAAGMHDAASMDEAERVSVGVFSDQKHAVHRAEQVQELGFKPVLSVHQRNVGAAWLDVDLKANDPDITPVPAPAATSSGTAPNAKVTPAENVRVIDCPARGASG